MVVVGKARGGILGTINFHAAASRSQEVNAVLTKYLRGGGGGGSRKSSAHQSKNYIPNTQSISSTAAACDQAWILVQVGPKFGPRWSRRRKSISRQRWPITQSLAPIRCPITQNLETHNVQCQALERYINLRPRRRIGLGMLGRVHPFLYFWGVAGIKICEGKATGVKISEMCKQRKGKRKS